MKNILILICVFLFGILEGHLIQKAYFNTKPVEKYDILPIDSQHEIKINDIDGQKYIHLSYDSFKQIIKQKQEKEILTKLDALFYRMDDSFVPDILKKNEIKVLKESKPIYNKDSIQKSSGTGTCNWENCST